MSKGLIRMDMALFIALLLMLGFGLVLVYSSSFALAELRFGGSEYFFARQMVRALLALAGFMIFINVDYHIWGKLSNLGYLAAGIMLLLVLILPSTDEINGAKRWLKVYKLTFQVSDFARMALILFVARHVEQVGTDLRQPRVYFRLVGAIVLPCLLIMLEPGFSTSALIGLIAVTMLFIGGAKLSHMALMAGTAVPLAILAALKMHHSLLRIMAFVQKKDGVDSFAYQVRQSLIGLGNGGLFGVGIGKGEQKFFYLPEPHTDFVISILGEEIGFIGLTLVAVMFGFIIYRGMRIARQAPDRSGRLMAFGFTFTIALYALLHAAVAVGLIPTTGIPLPFISYGGMSLVFMVCSMGIVLNISSQSTYGIVPRETVSSGRLPRRGRGKKRPL